jgi:hypothetical protein
MAMAARPCSRQGAGEHGGMECARASWSCGDAISVPGSAGGGAEEGRRRGGGSGFTGGNGDMVFWWLGCRRAVKKLLGRFYGMMWCCWCPWLGLRGSVAASRRRGRAAAVLELAGAAGTTLGCGKLELDGSVSCKESRRCYWSTRSGMGSSSGGCRRRPEAAAEVRRGVVPGRGNGSGNSDA